MNYPQKISTLATEAVGDGLGVFDSERAQSFVLNSTSALVFQHCDGQTTPQQLTELLRRKFNLPQAEADQVTRLALDELEAAGLLVAGVALMPPPAATYSRRQALTSFAALGLSVALMPMIARVAQAGGGHTLIPLLECVDDNGNGTYTAHFGYVNQSGSTITLPVGPKNMFVPGQEDFGQPTAFLPGEHLNVFSVVFPGTEELKWMLKADGDRRHQVVASAQFEACTATTFPPTSTGSPGSYPT